MTRLSSTLSRKLDDLVSLLAVFTIIAQTGVFSTVAELLRYSSMTSLAHT